MSDLENLRGLAEIRYHQQRQVFAQIQKEEKDLRAELKRIADLDQPVKTQSEHLGGMRAIGADVLWRGWLARSRTSLNLQLARVLARKAQEQDQVRRAFGKVIALDSLIAEERADRTKSRAQSQLDDAIGQALRPYL